MLGDMSGKCVPGFADFARAAEIDLATKDTGENDRRKVTHKTTQHVRAEGCRESQADLPAQKKTPVLPGFATDCGVLLNCQVEDRGLEPQASSCGNTGVRKRQLRNALQLVWKTGQSTPIGPAC